MKENNIAGLKGKTCPGERGHVRKQKLTAVMRLCLQMKKLNALYSNLHVFLLACMLCVILRTAQVDGGGMETFRIDFLDDYWD